MQSRKVFMMMCVLLAKSCRGHRLPLNATIIAPTNVTRLKTWVDMRWKLCGAIHASAAQQKKHIKPSAIRQLSTTIAYDADHFLSLCQVLFRMLLTSYILSPSTIAPWSTSLPCQSFLNGVSWSVWLQNLMLAVYLNLFWKMKKAFGLSEQWSWGLSRCGSLSETVQLRTPSIPNHTDHSRPSLFFFAALKVSEFVHLIRRKA